MARPSKNGKYFNCYLDADIYDKLEAVCALTGQKKTAVLETALSSYIRQFENSQGCVSGIEAIYREGDTEYNRKLTQQGLGQSIIRRKCLVLDEKIIFGASYATIYLDGGVISVPAYQIEYPE